MLCERCANLSSPDRPEIVGRAVPMFAPIDRAIGHLCGACGGPFFSGDPLDAMVRTLLQLARFGLGAGAGPLLISSRKEG